MVDLILGIVGMLLYPLFSIIFILLDTLQMVFYSLAGIGELYYGNTIFDWTAIGNSNTGAANDTGLIYFLLHSDLVKNMFMSILLLAIFLLIIFTVMAFLKNAYSAKPKSWKEIIGNALKGIMNFVFVPVCCFLGVWVGNILLNAINGATSQGGSTLMSRKLFIAAAYNANHYRNGIEEGSWLLKWSWDLAFATDWLGMGAGIPFEKEAITDNLSQEEMANMMDQVFASGSISIYDWYTVSQGYSLYQINYLTLIVGGVFMLYVLITLAYAMVRRMFIILMLFIISPAMCAMYPLDEGKALGSWRGDFFKQVISAYGAVAGMNLFFSLLPIVSNIRLSGGNTGFWGVVSSIINRVLPVDTIIQLLIMVAGLFVVKEFISMISGYIGAEDAYSQGKNLRSTMKTTIKDKTKESAKKIGAFKARTKNFRENFGNTKLGKWMGNTTDALFSDKTRKQSGIGFKEWHNMSKEERDQAKQDVRLDKAFAKKSGKKYNKNTRTDRLAAEKDARDNFVESQGYDLGDFSEQERDAMFKNQLTKNRAADLESYKNSKVINKVGKGLSGVGNWFQTSALGQQLYEESGIKDLVDAGQDEYDAQMKKNKKRKDTEKKGSVGELEAENKVVEAIQELQNKKDSGVYITGMTSEVLAAMGEKIGEATFKNSKKNLELGKLGLSDNAKLEDVRAVDSNLRIAGRGINNIADSSGNPALAEKFIKNLEEKLLDMDTSGNSVLASSVQQALSAIADNAGKTDVNAVASLVGELEKAFASMTAASEKNAREMQKALESNQAAIVKAVKEADKK